VRPAHPEFFGQDLTGCSNWQITVALRIGVLRQGRGAATIRASMSARLPLSMTIAASCHTQRRRNSHAA
jgi:hypothetical protein